jgi:hypothetical protein
MSINSIQKLWYSALYYIFGCDLNSKCKEESIDDNLIDKKKKNMDEDEEEEEDEDKKKKINNDDFLILYDITNSCDKKHRNLPPLIPKHHLSSTHHAPVVPSYLSASHYAGHHNHSSNHHSSGHHSSGSHSCGGHH